MNHVCETHSDVIHLATLATPILIGIRSTADSTTHYHTVLSFACSNHVEPVTNMCFLIVPYTPVIVESIVEEILHSILKLGQLVVADISIPAHDKGLAKVVLDNTLDLLEQFIPLVIIHLVKNGLSRI